MARSRRRTAIITTTLVGIVGFTLLQPHVPNGILDVDRLSVQEMGFGDGKQIIIETPYLRYETANQLEDRAPETAGWFAVWQGLTEKGWQVFMFDGKTSRETQLTDTLGDQIDVHTDGRYVVWQGRGEGKWNIYRYDAENPEDPIVKLNTAAPAMHPRISKGNTVWQQWVGKDWEIFSQDLRDEPVQLTENDLPDIQPDIFHSLAVWTVVRPGPLTRIRAHNLRDAAQHDLIEDTDGQIRPEFSSDGTLSWFDFAGKGYAKVEYNFLTDILDKTVIVVPAEPYEIPGESTPAPKPIAPPAEEPAPPEEKPPAEEPAPPVEEPTPPPEVPPAPVEEPPAPPAEEPAPPAEQPSV